MKTRYPAIRVALHSSMMILLVYVLLQSINYFRDNMIFGVDDLSMFVPTVWGFVGSTVLPPCALFGIWIWALALPLQRAERTLASGGQLSPEDIEKTRRRLLTFSYWILGFNLFGFAAGYLLSLALQGRFGDLLRMEGIVIMSSNISAGFVYAKGQDALNDMVFAPLRERLGIREIGGRKREMPSWRKQALLTGFLLFYALSFTQYQAHDFAAAKVLETNVMKRVASGEIAIDQMEAEYRASLAKGFRRFSTRPSLDVATVALPWERDVTLDDLQESISVMVFIFIFFITLGVQIAFSTGLRQQIEAVRDRIRDVVAGEGDLRIRLNLRAMDDIGELSEGVNRLLDQFQAIVGRIKAAASDAQKGADTIHDVVVSGRQVSMGAALSAVRLKDSLESQAEGSRVLMADLESFKAELKKVADTVEEQARFVDETSAATEEMRANIDAVASITSKSRELSEALASQGERGGVSAAGTASAIKEIDDSAKEVLGVLGSLDKIAASINLLAMNAAIEAAHAGQAGAGFAVVAGEVRNLAVTAASLTKHIKTLIDAMGKRVKEGVDRSAHSGGVLSELVAGLAKASELSAEIAEAMKEQRVGTSAVADAVLRVVEASRTVRERASAQDERAGRMNAELQRAFDKLHELASESRGQASKVEELERAFSAVNDATERTVESVALLTAQVERFEA
jgi:methyl-accepting chemotaxis protein